MSVTVVALLDSPLSSPRTASEIFRRNSSRDGSFTPGPGQPQCPLLGLRVLEPDTGIVIPTGGEVRYDCAEESEAVTQRNAWLADFRSRFAAQLPVLEDVTVRAVPEPRANALAAAALLALLALRLSSASSRRFTGFEST